MSELKRCPFCGEKAEIKQKYTKHDDVLKMGFKIKCTICLVETTVFIEKEEAIKAWNTRKPMERIVERLEESKENNYRCSDSPNYLDGGYEVMNEAIEIVKEGGCVE